MRYEIVPQNILESYADPNNGINIADALRTLPPDQAVLIAAIYICGLTLTETANLLHISRSCATRKKKLSIAILKTYATN